MYDFIKNNKKSFIYGLCWVLAFFVQLYMIRFGVDVTDQSFWVAESILLVNGEIPLYTNLNQTPFTSLLIAPFIKLYLFVNNGTNGVILYSFVVAVIFRFICSTTIYLVLKKYFSNLSSFLFAICFFVLQSSDRGFTYNSISLYLLLTCLIFVFSALNNSDFKKSVISYRLAGILMGITVIAHAGMIYSCVYIAVLVLIIEKRKGKYLKISFNYILYGFFIALGLVLYLLLSTKGEIFSTLDYFLDYNYFNIVNDSITSNINILREKILVFLPFLILTITISTILKIVFIRYKVSLSQMLTLVLPVIVLLSIIYSFLSLNYSMINTNSSLLIEHTLFIIILILPCYFFTFKSSLRKMVLLFLVVYIPSVLQLYSSATLSHSYINTRLYLLSPASLLFFIFALQSFKDNFDDDFKCIIFIKRYVYSIAISVSVLICSISYYTEAYNVYRDSIMPNLTYKITDGVYSGLYTTPERGMAIQEIENSLIQQIDEEKTILFADLFPAGYLMTESEPFTPSTWDAIMYRYNFLDMKAYENYFNLKNDIPEQIVFVNSENLPVSINDSKSEFSQFVKENYILDYEYKNFDELFSYKLYTKEDT